MSIKLEVWGDYALFTRPEMKVERVSYDVMTPSAARGLIEAIYWHPGLTWVIDRVHVCAPIHFTNLRRNEVKSTIPARNVRTVMERGSGDLYLSTSRDIQQRAALLLRDVHYVIEAHFEMTEKASPSDNPGEIPGYYQTPDKARTVLPSTLLRLPGISLPTSACAKNSLPALRNCRENGIWADALRPGLHPIQRISPPCFSTGSSGWRSGSPLERQ